MKGYVSLERLVCYSQLASQPAERALHTSHMQLVDILYDLIDRDLLCCVVCDVFLCFFFKIGALYYVIFVGGCALLSEGCISTLVMLPHLFE